MVRDKTRWIDVSTPLRAEMAVWPGDTPFAFSEASRIAAGAMCNVSALTMSTHAGTHIDAPWHFEDDGKTVLEIDPDIFFGPATVIDLSGRSAISADDLGDEALPERVLIRTDNSKLSLAGAFREDYVAVMPDAAQRMVDDGVRLVGVDYLSVAPYDQPDATHHVLLQNEVLIVEGLRLGACPIGTHEFVVLPLPVEGADGAPCRAFLGVAED